MFSVLCAIPTHGSTIIVGDLPDTFAGISFTVPDGHGDAAQQLPVQDSESFSFTFVATGGSGPIGLMTVRVLLMGTAWLGPVAGSEFLSNGSTAKIFQDGHLLAIGTTITSTNYQGSSNSFVGATLPFTFGAASTVTITSSSSGGYGYHPMGPVPQQMAGLVVTAGVSFGIPAISAVSSPGPETITLTILTSDDVPEASTSWLVAAGLIYLLFLKLQPRRYARMKRAHLLRLSPAQR